MTGPARFAAEFDQRLAEPVVPHCVQPACPFNELCPTVRQVGIASLFQAGRYRRLEDCLWWEKLVELTRRTLGIEPPATAAELRDAMGKVNQGLPADAGDAYEADLG